MIPGKRFKSGGMMNMEPGHKTSRVNGIVNSASRFNLLSFNYSSLYFEKVSFLWYLSGCLMSWKENERLPRDFEKELLAQETACPNSFLVDPPYPKV
jgi:hypothetical protein